MAVENILTEPRSNVAPTSHYDVAQLQTIYLRSKTISYTIYGNYEVKQFMATEIHVSLTQYFKGQGQIKVTLRHCIPTPSSNPGLTMISNGLVGLVSQ